MEMFLLMTGIILLGYLVYVLYLKDDVKVNLKDIREQLKVVFKGKNDKN
tara:strand:+ start:1289 stop:1435 length:147 start_codon:yes stop_codon:yes gene_type:complete